MLSSPSPTKYYGMALCPSDGVAARGFVNGRGPQPREALAHGRDRTEGPYRSEGHRACRIVQSAPYPILSALLRFLDCAQDKKRLAAIILFLSYACYSEKYLYLCK